jgi:ArsR family transcriptional regulator
MLKGWWIRVAESKENQKVNSEQRLPEEALDLLAERFKVFSEPMRLKLIYALMDGEKTVSELMQSTGGMQANVSKHLGMLLDAGVVGRRKQGLQAYYRIVDESIYEMCETVCGSLEERLAADLDIFSSFNSFRRMREQ